MAKEQHGRVAYLAFKFIKHTRDQVVRVSGGDLTTGRQQASEYVKQPAPNKATGDDQSQARNVISNYRRFGCSLESLHGRRADRATFDRLRRVCADCDGRTSEWLQPVVQSDESSWPAPNRQPDGGTDSRSSGQSNACSHHLAHNLETTCCLESPPLEMPRTLSTSCSHFLWPQDELLASK